MTFFSTYVMSKGDTPGEGVVVACLHRRMVHLHTHSLTYHVFARVVSRCLPCGFRLHGCPSPMVGLPNCRGFPLTTLSLASSQLLMQTLRANMQMCY